MNDETKAAAERVESIVSSDGPTEATAADLWILAKAYLALQPRKPADVDLEAENERLKEFERAVEGTVDERDKSEEAADRMASLILGEPIDWAFHDDAWQRALDNIPQLEQDAKRWEYFVKHGFEELRLFLAHTAGDVWTMSLDEVIAAYDELMQILETLP